VVLGRGEQGDLVAWRAGPVPGRPAGDLEADPRWADGEFVAPLLGGAPVDPTGAGDAYVAALAACLLAGADPQQLARLAAAAAASTVGYAGGRPALVPAVLGQIVRRHARFDQPG
jgi:ribokinase